VDHKVCLVLRALEVWLELLVYREGQVRVAEMV